MPPVSVLIKPASGQCNMKCDYCFYCDETEKRNQASYGMMTEKTLKNVIRKAVLSAEKACTIAFQGGEPTLRGLDFFKKAVEYTKQYNLHHIKIDFALQTNGYGITEEWCRFFKENHFLIGLSVDGLKEIHNTYRHSSSGKETFDRILHTSELFDKYQIDYNILTVVHAKVAENIEEIYDFYKKRSWRYLQFITCLDPLGDERGRQSYSLHPEAYGVFLTKLFNRWYKDWKRNQQPFIRQFENYVGILSGFMPESCEQRGTCGIQNVVEADGSVYPCDFYMLDEYRLGNFNTDSMKQIGESRKNSRFIERSYNHSEKCKACQWFGLCRGGCFRSRDGEEDNYFCEGYRYFFEQCYDKLKEIADYINKKV